MSSIWDLVVAEATTNLCTNPSFETNTTGWATGGTNTIAQSSDQSKFGVYSLKCTYQDNVLMAYYGITLTAAAHSISVWVYIPSSYDGTQIQIRFSGFTDGVGTATGNADMTKTDRWQAVTVENYTPVAGDLAGFIYGALETGSPTAGKYIYIDAVQCEVKDHCTTYCDGTQPGCEWNGTKHATTSTRSALEPTGGRVYDLYDSYGFRISEMVGAGAIPLRAHFDEYAIASGGELNNIKEGVRQFSLVGTIEGANLAAIHASRESLLNVLDPLRFGTTPQPVRLRYTGATTDKEISAYYVGGLEGDLQSRSPRMERVALQFEAPDPRWYQVGETAAVLDSSDNATLYFLAGKSKSTGQWGNLGLTAVPDGGGADFLDMAYNHVDGKIYVVGDFTGMDSVVGRDYVAAYDPVAGTWETVGAASAINGIVYGLAIASNGDVYIGGAFTNVGDANGDYLAYYDLSGGVWASVSGGGTANVYCLAFGKDGTLYFGGDFINWNAIAAADCIAKWTGAAYAAVGAGADDIVRTLAVNTANGYLYAGGDFTTMDGDAMSRVAYYSGSDWYTMGAGVEYVAVPASTAVSKMIVAPSGAVYIAGYFSSAGAISTNNIVKWNGTEYEALGSGLDGWALGAALAPSGELYVGGVFSEASGLSYSACAAMWNGYSWSHLDISLPLVTFTQVNSIIIGPVSPVNDNIYDIFLSTDQSAGGYYAGTTTVTNSNNQNVQPKIIIKRVGGTEATLLSVRNETTGKKLLFDYSLLNNETLTIDIANQSVVSDYWGARPDALITGSDVSDFALKPGSNNISCLIIVTGAPTLTAALLWKAAYRSQDD